MLERTFEMTDATEKLFKDEIKTKQYGYMYNKDNAKVEFLRDDKIADKKSYGAMDARVCAVRKPLPLTKVDGDAAMIVEDRRDQSLKRVSFASWRAVARTCHGRRERLYSPFLPGNTPPALRR